MPRCRERRPLRILPAAGIELKPLPFAAAASTGIAAASISAPEVRQL